MLVNRDPRIEDRSPESDKGLISAVFTFAFGLAVVGAIFTALLYHRHSTEMRSSQSTGSARLLFRLGGRNELIRGWGETF